MTASEAMRIAEAAGIQITIDGDSLVLAAPVEPRKEVIELLAHNKAAIIKLLRKANDGLSLQDWEELFDERAGIAEFEGGLPREQAEVHAFSYCVDEWLDRNPVRSRAGCCGFCGQSQGRLWEYMCSNSTRETSEVWLHHECSQAWYQEREEEAVEALTALFSFSCDIEKTLN
jgi:hypothetical protein